jgi:hypothetical protein
MKLSKKSLKLFEQVLIDLGIAALEVKYSKIARTPVKTKKEKKSYKMPLKARKAIGIRMKKMWAEKRKNNTKS